MKMCQGCGSMLDHGLIVCGDCAQRMVLLPGTEADYEALCAKVHEAWWFEKEKQGADHPNMVPYIELSEEDKDYDRATVRAVLDALQGGKKRLKHCNIRTTSKKAHQTKPLLKWAKIEIMLKT